MDGDRETPLKNKPDFKYLEFKKFKFNLLSFQNESRRIYFYKLDKNNISLA